MTAAASNSVSKCSPMTLSRGVAKWWRQPNDGSRQRGHLPLCRTPRQTEHPLLDELLPGGPRGAKRLGGFLLAVASPLGADRVRAEETDVGRRVGRGLIS